MKLIIEIPDNKLNLAKEFFKSINFIRNVKVVEKNEITNDSILKSIEQYESQKDKPTPLNLDDLKKMIHA